MSEKKILHVCNENKGIKLEDMIGSASFFCPACKIKHSVRTAPWGWNGSESAPSFVHSVAVHGVKNAKNDPTPTVCHSMVKDGQIRFLGDCTHELKGKTVPLEAF